MQKKELSEKHKSRLKDFTAQLSGIYKKDLVSVILYGSAASGEFVERDSDINLLVVLKETDSDSLAKATALVNKLKFRNIDSLFFTESYIDSSLDVFPIEFLDMKENYAILYGRDVLQDKSIDLENLRFQCEHELRARFIKLQRFFVKSNRNSDALKAGLLKSFTSILHILRNVLRLKGNVPRYLKEDTIGQLAQELGINADTWKTILALKNKQVRLNSNEIKRLFFNFITELERVVGMVDNF